MIHKSRTQLNHINRKDIIIISCYNNKKLPDKRASSKDKNPLSERKRNSDIRFLRISIQFGLLTHL